MQNDPMAILSRGDGDENMQAPPVSAVAIFPGPGISTGSGNPADEPTYSEHTVEIRKSPGQTLGFYIREGNGMGCERGVFISRIAAGTIGDALSKTSSLRPGLLLPGDEILSVNGVDVTKCTNLDDVVILMSIHRVLHLKLRRLYGHPSRSGDAVIGSIQTKPAWHSPPPCHPLPAASGVGDTASQSTANPPRSTSQKEEQKKTTPRNSGGGLQPLNAFPSLSSSSGPVGIVASSPPPQSPSPPIASQSHHHRHPPTVESSSGIASSASTVGNTIDRKQDSARDHQDAARSVPTTSNGHSQAQQPQPHLCLSGDRVERHPPQSQSRSERSETYTAYEQQHDITARSTQPLSSDHYYLQCDEDPCSESATASDDENVCRNGETSVVTSVNMLRRRLHTQSAHGTEVDEPITSQPSPMRSGGASMASSFLRRASIHECELPYHSANTTVTTTPSSSSQPQTATSTLRSRRYPQHQPQQPQQPHSNTAANRFLEYKQRVHGPPHYLQQPHHQAMMGGGGSGADDSIDSGLSSEHSTQSKGDNGAGNGSLPLGHTYHTPMVTSASRQRTVSFRNSPTYLWSDSPSTEELDGAPLFPSTYSANSRQNPSEDLSKVSGSNSKPYYPSARTRYIHHQQGPPVGSPNNSASVSSSATNTSTGDEAVTPSNTLPQAYYGSPPYHHMTLSPEQFYPGELPQTHSYYTPQYNLSAGVYPSRPDPYQTQANNGMFAPVRPMANPPQHPYYWSPDLCYPSGNPTDTMKSVSEQEVHRGFQTLNISPARHQSNIAVRPAPPPPLSRVVTDVNVDPTVLGQHHYLQELVHHPQQDPAMFYRPAPQLPHIMSPPFRNPSLMGPLQGSLSQRSSYLPPSGVSHSTNNRSSLAMETSPQQQQSQQQQQQQQHRNAFSATSTQPDWEVARFLAKFNPSDYRIVESHHRSYHQQSTLGMMSGSVGPGVHGLCVCHLVAGLGLHSSQAMLRDLYCVIEIDSVRRARSMIRTSTECFEWDETFELDLYENHWLAFMLYQWDPHARHRLCFYANVNLVSWSGEMLAQNRPPRGSSSPSISGSTGSTTSRTLEKMTNSTSNGAKDDLVSLQLEPKGQLYLQMNFISLAQCFPRQPSSLQSGGVFGVPLDVVVQRERSEVHRRHHHQLSRQASRDSIEDSVGQSNSMYSCPLLVIKCVQEIDKRGLQVAGIYRINGSNRLKNNLRDMMERSVQKTSLQSDAVPDVHAITALLKDYLRELPQPLFTDNLYRMVLDALRVIVPGDQKHGAKLMLNILECLPPCNQSTVLYLLDHLKRVLLHSNANQMSALDLATCLGPILLHPSPECAAQLDVSLLEPKRQVEAFKFILEIWPTNGSSGGLSSNSGEDTTGGGPPMRTSQPSATPPLASSQPSDSQQQNTERKLWPAGPSSGQTSSHNVPSSSSSLASSESQAVQRRDVHTATSSRPSPLSNVHYSTSPSVMQLERQARSMESSTVVSTRATRRSGGTAQHQPPACWSCDEEDSDYRHTSSRHHKNSGFFSDTSVTTSPVLNPRQIHGRENKVSFLQQHQLSSGSRESTFKTSHLSSSMTTSVTSSTSGKTLKPALRYSSSSTGRPTGSSSSTGHHQLHN